MPVYSADYFHRAIDHLYAEIERLKAPLPRAVSTLRTQRQADIAERMGISQPAVSQIERSSVLNESTLRSYVEACGATLEFVARRPDGQLVRLATRIHG